MRRDASNAPRRALARLAAAAALAFASGLLDSSPAAAASNKVRITSLSDVAFGTIANLGVDAVRSQSVCLYADTSTNGYTITATGTGPAGTFQLTSGLAAMTYEVEWSSSAGQSTGLQLTPNVPLTGQVSPATHQTCNNGPATSASLILMLRSSALSSAQAGTYNGTLTLIVGPE
ncbi:MAG TPA: hypothetical protein VJ775_02905 [Sphingomicrobium sp.]|nr:hypothetical protein [Sphingomicrobium sp.]